MKLLIDAPNWDALIGGTVETAWTADRHRKLELATALSLNLERVFVKLQNQNALFKATPASLLSDAYAPLWYVSISGFSSKTLKNTKEIPDSYGMKMLAGSFLDSLFRALEKNLDKPKLTKAVQDSLLPFCRWINHEIDSTFPLEQRSDHRAYTRVALILGGKIIGQGQNDGGNEGVVLVKEFLYRELCNKNDVYICIEKGKWIQCLDSALISSANLLRFGQYLEIDFTSGGNRPDILVSFQGNVIAVGEIKARKDLSNVWESWMPQIANHMNTWAQEFPNAARLFFGTIITEQMIEGKSMKGTQHLGLRHLHKIGQLTSAYNISHFINRAQENENGLNNLISILSDII